MIEFREETHEYFLDGKKLISVTQLMRKHGLAPSYDGVPSEVLKAKAERGTLIHQEIEDYIKRGNIGFTTELCEFITKTQERKVLASERIVYNDVVAGTVDLVFYDGTIADIKTTATLHREAVSWQLSIYAYLWSNFASEIGLPTKGQAYHFQADGSLNVVDIPLKPMAEVEKLMDCERNGTIYTPALTIGGAALAELVEVENLIKQIEEQKKQAEAQAQELRAAIMRAMQENGITTFENDRVRLTYISPTTRTSIDSARLKKELPDIAAQYTKTSVVKESLRITLREE
jgi:regulator of replication initiation timing